MGVGSRVPGPRGVGTLRLRQIRRDPLGFFVSVARRYGPLARVRLGPVRLFAVNDPALVMRVLVDDADGYKKGMALERARVVLGDGLLTSEGELHRRQLRLIGPSLSPRRLAQYEPGMIAEAERLDTEWRDGATVDIGAEMSRLTLRIVVATLLGGRLASGDSERVQAGLTGVMRHFDWLVTHPLGIHRLRIPTPRVRRLLASRADLWGVVDRLIAERATRGGHPDDLLADLIAARDDAGGMDATLLRDEVLTLMLAGHETTANWLTFTWLSIADDPGIGRRLRAELDRELGGRTATLADRERLPYTEAVLQEALRMFPPAWGVGRRARSARRLGWPPGAVRVRGLPLPVRDAPGPGAVGRAGPVRPGSLARRARQPRAARRLLPVLRRAAEVRRGAFRARRGPARARDARPALDARSRRRRAGSPRTEGHPPPSGRGRGAPAAALIPPRPGSRTGAVRPASITASRCR